MPRLSPIQSYSVLWQLDMKGRVQCKLAIFWPILLPQLKKELENGHTESEKRRPRLKILFSEKSVMQVTERTLNVGPGPQT